VAKGVDLKILIERFGGQFRLTTIIQKRIKELVKGARPLVEVPKGRRDWMDIVLQELNEGRIEPSDDVPEPPAGEQIFRPVVSDDEE